VIRRALIIAGAFALLHVAGGRDEVGFLSGSYEPSLLGALYTLAWFGTVIVVPILVIAAGISACGKLAEGWLASRRR
jgi:hypothetical protein